MTDWQTVAAASPTTGSRRVVAPGWILYIASFVVVGLAAEAASQPDLRSAMILGAAWMGLGLAWVATIGVSLVLRRPGWSVAHLVRWLGVPALLLFAAALMVTDVAMQVRFELSRGAMDALVADVRTGHDPIPDTAGLFHVKFVDELSGGVQVFVGSVWWDQVGFWWFADPAGPDLGRGVGCDCDLSPLGGGWWSFVEHF